MIIPSPLITFLPLLISLTIALPSPLRYSLSAREPSLAAEETWHIPRLNMHMMSTSTGIPGSGPWPESSKFDSTIDFDVVVPEEAPLGTSKWNCKGTMKNGTIIEDVVGCVNDQGGVGDVSFGMTGYAALGERRPELSFWLWVHRVGILDGATAITANDPQESSSYLTCLLGRPFDGLRCEIGSYLSVRKELVIEGSEVR
ncbi:hypothetical protein BKA58DRAFT_316440 [Alternaria rosae]|uniref:uncharacterized protein n=1 Tax=Alternaria rosae TaxID=1187941 RepID=UPI001E8CC41D|nr:uncharacterized protein BKA58DRAFT_326918 [Alternaria rosae]XP_046024950.1 uncharacterized protein BKA58DRAFT_316440 [Alternaria rosae]KAH6845885.1 hypothetical protein BKA58DRAFT_326918 [Alternaria rosae]KAH6870094.1 hypothetical protein BKA58DRAFT_316440 [Alternaria rosae]